MLVLSCNIPLEQIMKPYVWQPADNLWQPFLAVGSINMKCEKAKEK